MFLILEKFTNIFIFIYEVNLSPAAVKKMSDQRFFFSQLSRSKLRQSRVFILVFVSFKGIFI